MNAKAKRQWLDYEKSLEPPHQDPPTEEPLRRSMEDLRLQSVNSPGASTSGNPKANRISRPKTNKKGKRSNNLKKDDSGAQKEVEAGLIMDPSGSVDPPAPKPRT